MTSAQSPRQRVLGLVAAARRLADADDALGRLARQRLPASTGLSPENVELALTTILETHPSSEEVEALLASVEPCPRAHVVLAANVFVAAHRAIALALAQTPRVTVRPSRREPELARLLAEASQGTFELADELRPERGDHVWGYGADESLGAISAGLPEGVTFHAHGSGLGLAFVELDGDAGSASDAAHALAADVVPFDQRGCLSPRIAVVVGSPTAARELARELALELDAAERELPLGRLHPDEQSQVTRWRDTMQFAAELLPAGRGWVSLERPDQHLVVPPVGRNVAVVASDDWPRLVSVLAPSVAAVGLAGSEQLTSRVAELLPFARQSPLGRMQRPRFDGPVDRRPARPGNSSR